MNSRSCRKGLAALLSAMMLLESAVNVIPAMASEEATSEITETGILEENEVPATKEETTEEPVTEETEAGKPATDEQGRRSRPWKKKQKG